MKTVLTCLLLLATLAASGQSAFNYQKDFKSILSHTKDAKNPLSYGKLLKRFKAHDTSMTNYEVLALMIGFTARPQYKPYADLSKEREIYMINGSGSYEQALAMADTFLNMHPLSVKTIFEKSYSFYKLGKQDSANYYSYQGRRIFKAMLFSGSGTSVDDPMFALGPADGQDFIYKYIRADIGSMGSGSDTNGNFLDILEAKFKDGSSRNFYFIIQHATDKMFGDEDLDDVIKKVKK